MTQVLIRRLDSQNRMKKIRFKKSRSDFKGSLFQVQENRCQLSLKIKRGPNPKKRWLPWPEQGLLGLLEDPL